MAEDRPPALPEALIMRIADALRAWVQREEPDLTRLLFNTDYEEMAGAAAAALLDGCRVRQEWRQVRPNGGTSTWFQGALRPGPPGWGAERRLVITTPAEPVEETREDGTQP